MTAVLERQLAELATRLDVDSGSTLAARVLARLDDDVPSRAAPWRRPQVWLATAAALVLLAGAAVIVPHSRHAVARFFGIGSTRIEPLPVTVTSTTSDTGAVPPASTPTTGATPTPTPTTTAPTATFPAELRLGEPVGAAAAGEQTGLPVPRAPGLEPSSGIFADTRGEFALVIVVYPPSTTLPASPVAGVGALLSTTRGFVDATFFLKFVDPGTTVDAVDVRTADGEVVSGIWLGGTSHVYVIDRAGDGSLTTDELRLATNTLLWQVGSTVYRFESALDRDAALAVAATVIPAPAG